VKPREPGVGLLLCGDRDQRSPRHRSVQSRTPSWAGLNFYGVFADSEMQT
jgi:hypothetical protein